MCIHNKLKKPIIVLPRFKEICVPVVVATAIELVKRVISPK